MELMSGIESTSPPDSPRSGQKHGGANTDDRISDLPDSIIGNILSFLPTKNAVATGILSERWNSLWTFAANLDFSCPRNYTGSVELFVQFVNYVLLFHKHGCFQSLSLTWNTGCLPFYLNTWIGVALDRAVSELFVSADVSKLPSQLQSSLFSSECLKSLELDCNICIPSSEMVFNLPSLERLKLTSVYFDSDKAIGKIVKGCPVLKYLIIHMDVGKMVQHGYLIAGDAGKMVEHGYLVDDGVMFDNNCMIFSASLTHLEISVNAFSSSPIPLKVAWGVELDVPSLNYIKLDGFLLSISTEQETLAFLDEANIKINGRLFDKRFYCTSLAKQSYCNSLVDAFGAFGCAKTLTLHDQVIRAFRYATVEMRTKFDRLTRLEVITDCCYWSSLQDFIMLSDNLQVLIVRKHVGLETDDVPDDDANSKEKKLDLVPRCLSKSLQTVSIGGYYGHRDELAMIEYLMKHASVLKILEIGFGDSITGDINRKLELVEEIGAFPRKSKMCEVKFHD